MHYKAGWFACILVSFPDRSLGTGMRHGDFFLSKVKIVNFLCVVTILTKELNQDVYHSCSSEFEWVFYRLCIFILAIKHIVVSFYSNTGYFQCVTIMRIPDIEADLVTQYSWIIFGPSPDELNSVQLPGHNPFFLSPFSILNVDCIWHSYCWLALSG